MVPGRYPADAQTGESVGLRHHAERQAALIHFGGGRQPARWIELQAAINLVGEQPDAVLAAQRNQAVEGRTADDLPSRVVREVDGDELRVGPDPGLERVEVEVPAVLWAQRHPFGRAQGERQLLRR